MKKGLIGVLVMSFAVLSIAASKPTQAEIIETIRIKPDVTILAENEVRYTQNFDASIRETTLQISQTDAQLLMQFASAEALNQGQDGMEKVMQVILNRVASDDFPDTVWEVVSQVSQFESYSNGTYMTADITAECHLALAEVEKNLDNDKSIVGFETVSNGKSLLRYFDTAYIFGDHVFYKQKSRP